MRITPAAAIILLAACAETEAPPEAGQPGLVLESSERGVSGSFENELGRIDFASTFVADQVLEIEFRFNDMIVTADIDYVAGIVEADGYASNGEATQMLDDDRALLTAFEASLEAPDASEPLVRLRSMAGILGEFPTEMDLKYQRILNTDRGAYSTCGYLNQYIGGTHDGWGESNWADNTTIDGAYNGPAGACNVGNSDSNIQTTWFWNGSAWTCPVEPSHSTSIEYAYGDCFGRCGGGCGSGHVYSYSCLDHDVCNRFGHSWSASVPPGHCSDEFANAGAESLSEPNCY
jgi:hypothetical protein